MVKLAIFPFFCFTLGGCHQIMGANYKEQWGKWETLPNQYSILKKAHNFPIEKQFRRASYPQIEDCMAHSNVKP